MALQSANPFSPVGDYLIKSYGFTNSAKSVAKPDCSLQLVFSGGERLTCKHLFPMSKDGIVSNKATALS